MSSSDWITLTFFLFVIVITLVIGIAQRKKREEMLTRQAEKRGGQVARPGLFRRTKLLLPYQGETLQIYSIPGSRDRPPRTVAQVQCDSPRFPEIRIAQNNLWRKFQGLLGKERILTGDDEFDSKFVMITEDQYWILRFLTDDFKKALLHSPFRSMDINIKPQDFRVTVMSIPRSDEEYDLFIDTVLSILQKCF